MNHFFTNDAPEFFFSQSLALSWRRRIHLGIPSEEMPTNASSQASVQDRTTSMTVRRITCSTDCCLDSGEVYRNEIPRTWDHLKGFWEGNGPVKDKMSRKTTS
ncbi:uncharacterized protein PV07_09474 [Cladophialophora immunda]|uniref:Uncharacterized protein n=1 Tax=Cladophialophora immunda TaxID=569365 RepID=A0A0D2CS02_9EURO|nr:uncharacterized protein PV07_09474 [Cladophialophora immunda]KIW26374.1 hypothetical protein PV07_09474 [Cladophialophora immunda]